jgi:hypothetical protein
MAFTPNSKALSPINREQVSAKDLPSTRARAGEFKPNRVTPNPDGLSFIDMLREPEWNGAQACHSLKR